LKLQITFGCFVGYSLIVAYLHYSVVTPERVSYSDNTVIDEGTAPRNVSQLGPPVDVSFLIRNSGPSRIDNIQLDISWPLNGSMIGESYYLYITSIQVCYG
jgi:hypothetical protein